MTNLDNLKTAIKRKKIILLGPTGSGKGNRSKDLKALGLIHVGLGAMMREKVRSDPGSELSRQIVETTEKGVLLPDALIFPVIDESLNRMECKEHGFVLEGFPRTKAQSDWLFSNIPIDLVLQLEVPRAFLVDGILLYNRRSCVSCLTTYSDFDPPKTEGTCDKCGGELIRRMSDSMERVKNRMEIYEREMNSFVADIRSRGILEPLPITVADDEIIDDKYCKKLNGQVFLVQTNNGKKARMLNYDGMRIRLYKFLEERFCK